VLTCLLAVAISLNDDIVITRDRTRFLVPTVEAARYCAAMIGAAGKHFYRLKPLDDGKYELIVDAARLSTNDLATVLLGAESEGRVYLNPDLVGKYTDPGNVSVRQSESKITLDANEDDVHVVLFELAKFLGRGFQVGPGVSGSIVIHVVDPAFLRPLALVLRQVEAICVYDGEEVVVLNGRGRWRPGSIGFAAQDNFGTYSGT
jgi:hypothetical protein